MIQTCLFFVDVLLLNVINSWLYKNKFKGNINKTVAEVCGAKACTFVCREINSSSTKSWSYQFDHQTKSFGRLRPVLSFLWLIFRSQPKDFHLWTYKRFMMHHLKAWYTVCRLTTAIVATSTKLPVEINLFDHLDLDITVKVFNIV